MNCKPNQLAFVKVPPAYRFGGVEQLNGRIVRTVTAFEDASGPAWVVDPPQYITTTNAARCAHGNPIPPGTRFCAAGLPDAWLQPFDPASEPEPVLTAEPEEVLS